METSYWQKNGDDGGVKCIHLHHSAMYVSKSRYLGNLILVFVSLEGKIFFGKDKIFFGKDKI